MVRNLGIVVIGRNEGERLKRSLASLEALAPQVVYVDSDSSDGSVAWARERGFSVLELDPVRPLTAARARNAGFDHLLAASPGLAYVQFVDGDCELDRDWLARGIAILETQGKAAAVCGWVREREPMASLYNRLCAIEWTFSPGELGSCGGNALFRVPAFREAGGFATDLVAGEEPELCLRLREAGWTILGIDAAMAIHDAGMTSFGQWWRRARRAGTAYAAGAARHGRGPSRHYVRECRSVLFWGLVIPVLSLLLMGVTQGASLLLWLGYPVLGARIHRSMRARGFPSAESALYASSCVLAKFPQLLGYMAHQLERWRGGHHGSVPRAEDSTS